MSWEKQADMAKHEERFSSCKSFGQWQTLSRFLSCLGKRGLKSSDFGGRLWTLVRRLTRQKVEVRSCFNKWFQPKNYFFKKARQNFASYLLRTFHVTARFMLAKLGVICSNDLAASSIRLFLFLYWRRKLLCNANIFWKNEYKTVFDVIQEWTLASLSLGRGENVFWFFPSYPVQHVNKQNVETKVVKSLEILERKVERSIFTTKNI